MDWLEENRSSDDVVAHNDVTFVREALDREPMLQSVLAMFAELVRGGGPVRRSPPSIAPPAVDPARDLGRPTATTVLR